MVLIKYVDLAFRKEIHHVDTTRIYLTHMP